VLVYRLLSCWIILPLGGLAAVILNRVPDPEAVTPADVSIPEQSPASALDRNVIVERQNRDVVSRRLGGESHGRGAEPGRDDVGVMASER